ncbi:MAG: dihydroorotase, partial [Coriobacteriaceae bacterium]|nr:dihydroorotase [Coriobacteriaceae bacterium]
LITHLVEPGEMSWQRLVEACAIAPRELLHIDPVTFEKGSAADITVVDPDETWTVTADGFISKASNSAFIGEELTGRATDVFTDGYASLEEGKVTF